jgi:sugar phosphate isomerase/epimerase
VGAIHYVLHSGLHTPVIQGPGIEDCYTRQRDWLHRCGEFARPLGVYVCVENLFGGHEGKTYASSCARLARELLAVNHPFVVATLDFGHAYLHTGFRSLDFLTDIAALAPVAKHVHLHDNCGIADDIWAYADGERVAFGHGDLHLPVGWGTIPWNEVMRVCEFPAAAIFNIELKQRHWHAVQECVDATCELVRQARLRLPVAAE